MPKRSMSRSSTGPVELQGAVYHPRTVAGRHLSLVVYVHRMPPTCEKPEDSQSRPCIASDRPIPSYRGYDYPGTELASHGYVVLSISANGTNAGKGGDDKYALVVRGANHNFFNTVWSPSGGLPGSDDDWGNNPADSPKSVCRKDAPTRLSEAQQRQVGTVWISSFFRYRLGGEHQLASLWQGGQPAPSSFGPAEVLPTYHAPAASRLDVNRLIDPSELQRDTAGGAVTLTGFDSVSLCGGSPPEPRYCLPDSETKYPLPNRIKPDLELRPGSAF